jgi:hypothetical protein
MTTAVEYTREANVDSSAVDGVYYNENDRTVAVILHGEVYRYSGVPLEFYNHLGRVNSVGREWLPQLKRTYGPGERLGSEYAVYFDDVTPWRAPKPAEPVKAGQVVGQSGSTGSSTGPHISLTVAAPALSNRVSVSFEVNGQTKVHESRANDVLEAVKNVTELLNLAGVDGKVKAATVYFD